MFNLQWYLFAMILLSLHLLFLTSFFSGIALVYVICITSTTKECVAGGMRLICIFSENVQCWLRQGITNAMLRLLLRCTGSYVASMVLKLPNTGIDTEQNFNIKTCRVIEARRPYNVLKGKKIRKPLSLMWLYLVIFGLGTRRLKMCQRTNILIWKYFECEAQKIE